MAPVRKVRARSTVSGFSNLTPSTSPIMAAYIFASEAALVTPLPAGACAARPAWCFIASISSPVCCSDRSTTLARRVVTSTPAPASRAAI
ncbi:MAG TPA: hypothetical protein VMU93_14445 [Caulobacteraceae bacterium]|nr:hypothetical protein [Caulobacteraceae bacterium]